MAENTGHTRATLANISRALGFPDDHLWRVSNGDASAAAPGWPDDELPALRAELAGLARRVAALEYRNAATSDR